MYESEALHTVASMAAQVAHADVPVLITGPNGAGKEVLADIVHANSRARSAPYIKVNAGALPEQLIEAELFGTETGAFTAPRRAPGVSKPPTAARCSSTRSATCRSPARPNYCACCRPANTNAWAATPRARQRAHRRRHQLPLRDAMREGRFREDLYYRL